MIKKSLVIGGVAIGFTLGLSVLTNYMSKNTKKKPKKLKKIEK